MDMVKFTRFVPVCSLVLLQLCVKTINTQSHIYVPLPKATLQALGPKGFRAFLPGTPGVTLFTFHGNINKPIGSDEEGTLSGEVVETTNEGRWVFEDLNVELEVGDVINYNVNVSFGGNTYTKNSLGYTVTKIECIKPTVTKVRGRSVCGGERIFEDHFDTLNEDFWQIEHYIPLNHPEFPFVSYQRLKSPDSTVSVEDGNLRIIPKLQQNLTGFNNESIYSGSLNLFSGCTGRSSAECSAEAIGANILPPVVSGRITSKKLAFTYGTVHVRAKLPQGDWIYPEILLEPLLKKYGKLNYASGVLKIVAARGNEELNIGLTDFGNKIIYGGPVMDLACRNHLLNERKPSNGRRWGEDFHEYTMIWTPDRISLKVDFQDWAAIEPAANGLRGHFAQNCKDVPQHELALGSNMAPFDDHFYLTLGVAVGGIAEFQDDLVTKMGHKKPWRNSDRKAKLNFWNDMDAWYPTWSQSEMIVDYIKIDTL